MDDSGSLGREAGPSDAVMRSRLEPWLRTQLSAPDLRVAGLSIPGNGASNITGLIEVEGHPGVERLVLRTVAPGAGQLYETYDLSRQYRVVEQLAPTGIRVPSLVGYEADTSVLGSEFYVMFDTGGRSVPERPSYHDAGWFVALGDAGQRRVWMDAIDIIGVIHGLDWEALGLSFLADPGSATDHNRAFVQRHSGHLEWMERRTGRTFPRLRSVFDWLEDNFPTDSPTSLLWADAKLGNLMIDGSEIVGVLDWEHATIGPSLYDLANWMVFDRLMSIGADVDRIPGLPDREETIGRYEQATGRPAADVDYFELFSAVRLANVVCGMAPDLVAAGFVPESFIEDNAGTRVLQFQLDAMGLDL